MHTTVHTSQEELLQSIVALWCPCLGGFELDPTYGRGNFYKGSIARPPLCFDISPQVPGVKPADVRNLPIADGVVSTCIFDPPFLHAHGKGSVIGNRFSSYPSQKLLHEMYRSALAELYRVLEPGGILAMKCQDTVEAGKQVWSHILVQQAAIDAGFTAVDLFILVGGGRIQGWNHSNQVHARKFHSYFWVFQKRWKR